MNYYDEIKNKLIDNEIYKKAKDYSKNRSDLNTYYEVGKLLFDAGKHYGEGIIKEYSRKLEKDIGKKYSVTTLKYIRQFYCFSKSHSLSDQLTYTHYKNLLSLRNDDEINYYINISVNQHLSVRELRQKIKSNEYERIPKKKKNKLVSNEETTVTDLIKNPVVIKNTFNTNEISEKMLKGLILEDLDNFLYELGEDFAYIGNEYKIKIGDKYNYIDLLLFNIKYNCYTVVELKVTELKKEHIGQVEIYMNYIDENIKKINQDKTIGIIITKKDNKYIMSYCSDKRIFNTSYILEEVI